MVRSFVIRRVGRENKLTSISKALYSQPCNSLDDAITCHLFARDASLRQECLLGCMTIKGVLVQQAYS